MARPSKIFWENNCSLKPMEVSPVEKRQVELPKGNGSWPGADHVYKKLQEACHYLASHRSTRLSDDHVELMAVLGNGHEESMKYKLSVAYAYGWAKPDFSCRR